MKKILLQGAILLIVSAGAFLAIYSRYTTEPIKSKPVEQPAHESPKEPPSKESHNLVEQSKPYLFHVDVDPKEVFHIGVFGESQSDSKDQQRAAVLEDILGILKNHESKAVFFTGNLVSLNLKKEEKKPEAPQIAKDLKSSLQDIALIYQQIMGPSTPFFPVLGDKELAIPDATQSFIKDFHLQGALTFGGELAYGVSIGPAFFAAVPTASLAPFLNDAPPAMPKGILEWLQDTLKAASKEHRFLFVVGYEPAFFEGVTFLKQNSTDRDKFWKILVDNHVLAYFSSREHFFDRSNRAGVWQIISGGGGAAHSSNAEHDPFFHALLLVISPDHGKAPTIQIYDINDNLVSEYELTEQNAPVYQMRISFNLNSAVEDAKSTQSYEP